MVKLGQDPTYNKQNQSVGVANNINSIFKISSLSYNEFLANNYINTHTKSL